MEKLKEALSIRIYTNIGANDVAEFTRLKRKKWGQWQFLISGEWSESPHHQGDHRFFITSTPDQRCWALKSTGFPTRIIAVARVNGDVSLEKVAGEMMRAVADQGGDYVDMIHDFGNVNLDLLWDTYTA